MHELLASRLGTIRPSRVAGDRVADEARFDFRRVSMVLPARQRTNDDPAAPVEVELLPGLQFLVERYLVVTAVRVPQRKPCLHDSQIGRQGHAHERESMRADAVPIPVPSFGDGVGLRRTDGNHPRSPSPS
jgi:hypothetical protein